MPRIPFMSHCEYVSYLGWKQDRGIGLTDLEECVVKRYERREELTSREERVLAYSYTNASCPSCGCRR